MKKYYCLGFAFNDDLNYVLLIRKQKPAWQKGLLNGIGGSIEPNETSIQAMVREFEEETGIITPDSIWTYIGIMQGKDWAVDIFKSILDICQAKQMTDEPVEIIKIDQLNKRSIIPNLNWIIPMCIQDDLHPFNVVYKSC